MTATVLRTRLPTSHDVINLVRIQRFKFQQRLRHNLNFFPDFYPKFRGQLHTVAR